MSLAAETLRLDYLTDSLKGRPIVTQIAPIGKWHAGEDYHQEYRMLPFIPSTGMTDIVVDNNPGGYECPTHRFYW